MRQVVDVDLVLVNFVLGLLSSWLVRASLTTTSLIFIAISPSAVGTGTLRLVGSASVATGATSSRVVLVKVFPSGSFWVLLSLVVLTLLVVFRVWRSSLRHFYSKFVLFNSTHTNWGFGVLGFWGFGLNRFVFAWLASFPAIIYVASQLN